MLYQIGLLTIDTEPLLPDRMMRVARADFAAKAVIGSLQPREAQGEGDDTLELSGTLLPFNVGGLAEFEIAHAMRVAQKAVPVLRGDGRGFGYHVITAVEEDHTVLSREGVGASVEYRIETIKVPPPSVTDASAMIEAMLDLFSVLR